MTAIQLILITGFAFLYIYFLLNLRKRIIELFFFTLLASGAILFISDPDLTTVIARKLGVQRGADLILYLSILLFSYLIMKLYLRIKKVEFLITNLIREDAINNLKFPNQLPLS